MLKRHPDLRTAVWSASAAFVMALALTASAPAGGLPCRYDVTDVITAPAPDSAVFGLAINDSDEVAGYYTVGLSNDRAFYWTRAGGFVHIPMPPEVFASRALDISNSGLVVGYMWSSSGIRGFIHDIHTGQKTILQTVHGQGECQVTGVNEAGVVCGFRSTDDGGDPWYPTTAFRWSASTGFEDLTPTGNSRAFGINESNQCAGWTVHESLQTAMRWNVKSLELLPSLAGLFTEALAIRDDGMMTGYSRISTPGFPPTQPQCVRWIGNSIENLGSLPGFEESRGLDCNADGTIVGDATDNNQANSMIIQGGLMRNLNDLAEYPSGDFTGIKGINASGEVVTDLATLQTLTAILRPQPPLAGDANGTCTVNVGDLLLVINQWNQKNGAAADLDDSGNVDVLDLIIVLDNWTS